MPPDPRTSAQKRDALAAHLCPLPRPSELERLFKDSLTKPTEKLWPRGVLNKALDALAARKNLDCAAAEKAKRQLLLRHMRDARERQLKKLKEWEGEINAIESSHPLVVDNAVDLEGPPTHMTYITRSKVIFVLSVAPHAGRKPTKSDSNALLKQPRTNSN